MSFGGVGSSVHVRWYLRCAGGVDLARSCPDTGHFGAEAGWSQLM